MSAVKYFKVLNYDRLITVLFSVAFRTVRVWAPVRHDVCLSVCGLVVADTRTCGLLQLTDLSVTHLTANHITTTIRSSLIYAYSQNTIRPVRAPESPLSSATSPTRRLSDSPVGSVNECRRSVSDITVGWTNVRPVHTALRAGHSVNCLFERQPLLSASFCFQILVI